jgi:IS5 family transposase
VQSSEHARGPARRLPPANNRWTTIEQPLDNHSTTTHLHLARPVRVEKNHQFSLRFQKNQLRSRNVAKRFEQLILKINITISKKPWFRR